MSIKRALGCVLLLCSQTLMAQVDVADDLSDDQSESFSSRAWNFLTDGASLSLGLGGRATSITVTRVATEESGKLIESHEDAVFISYSTKASYFNDSNVGYSWLFNLSSFELNEQELEDGSIVDLGTDASGAVIYVVPTLFYNIGDKYRGHYLRAGIGLGLGAMEFNGTVQLTQSASASDVVNISNGTEVIFFAVGVSIDYQYKNFTFRISSAGPNVQNPELDINFADTTLMLGYTFYMDDYLK